MFNDATQRVTEKINTAEAPIGDTSAERTRNQAKLQTVNEILKADKLLKEAVINLFVDNFSVLATHLSQYGELEVLQMRLDLIPGSVPCKSWVRPLNPDQRDNLSNQQGGIKPSTSPWTSLVPVK